MSGKGSSFSVKCHHSLLSGRKPWRIIASRRIMRWRNCSAVIFLFFGDLLLLPLNLLVAGLPQKSG